MGRINREFKFKAGVTTIGTPISELLERRAGVCQDFTHLMLAGLRALGLPGRYVSGYLRTRPPPGATPRRGADQSHAWVGAWLGPGLGWVDLDPTNDILVAEEHVVLAWGRDYGDISPVRGVILGGGRHTVDVGVDLEPLEGMSLAAPVVSAAAYRRGVLLVAGAMLIWSTAGILARLVATDPWTTLFWRSLYAIAALLAYLAWRDGARMFDGFRRLGPVGFAMALCFGVSMICFINALALTTVAAVLVFQAAAPLFAATLAWLLLREQVSREKLIAIGVTMAGVGFMVSGAEDAGRLWGNLLSAAMGLTYAGTVVLARAGRDVPTTEATLLGVVLVALVSFPFAELAVPAGEMALLATFGIVQMGLALVMFTTGIRLIPSADAGLISVLEAVAAPLWVWVFLGEDPGWRTLAGGAVVLAAVVTVAWREAR